MTWTLYEGDCLDVMRGMESKSVDAVITDPPYFLEWKAPINIKGRKSIFHHKEATEVWDKNNKIQEFYWQLYEVFDRIVNDFGCVVCFVRSEYITYAVDAAEGNNFDHKATIFWHKTNPVPQVRKRNYLSSVECLVWATRYDEQKSTYTFNFSTQKEMHNFIETPICMGKERTNHPAQKPEKVIEKIIKIHTNEGNLILDPFAGTGTVLYVAEQINRNSIGIEIDSEYCNIIRKRMDNMQLNLFGLGVWTP